MIKYLFIKYLYINLFANFLIYLFICLHIYLVAYVPFHLRTYMYMLETYLRTLSYCWEASSLCVTPSMCVSLLCQTESSIEKRDSRIYIYCIVLYLSIYIAPLNRHGQTEAPLVELAPRKETSFKKR